MSTNKGSRRRKRKADGDVLAVIGWFWRDWRASTARAAMSPLARGVYRELLDAHWGERDCSLPDDDRMLAALAGVSAEEWASVKGEVLPWLPLNAKGRRQNPRARAAWKEALAFREEKREAGKQGAAKRWHSHGRPTAEPLANDGPPPHSSASLLLHTDPDPERVRAGPSSGEPPVAQAERGYAPTAAAPPVEPRPPSPQAPGAGRSRPDRLPDSPTTTTNDTATAQGRDGRHRQGAGTQLIDRTTHDGESRLSVDPGDSGGDEKEAHSRAAHRLELAIGCSFKQAIKAVQSLVVAGADLAWIEARIKRSNGTVQTPWEWTDDAKSELASVKPSRISVLRVLED